MHPATIIDHLRGAVVEADTEGGRCVGRHAGLRLDLERWAEALAIERLHGPEASAHIEARIAELAKGGDAAGVARMRQIAGKLDQLDPANAAVAS